MSPKPSSAGAFIKGVDASTGLYLQPRGSVPRASNLVLTKRGSLKTCDGSAILAAFNGVPTSGRGKSLCEFLFSPTGVPPYMLRLMAAPSKPLGAPQNLSAADGGGSGTPFLSGTYYWKVTAFDSGNETLASNEATATIAAGHVANLVWNIVPNAVGYWVYRGNSSGAERFIYSTVPQPAAGSLTVNFTDAGYTPTARLVPVADNTQQTALYVMGAWPGSFSYTDANIVALFPASTVAVWGSQIPPTNTTPSGGIVGAVAPTPQIIQFINQAIIALGNGYPPQLYSDNTGTQDNPATISHISSISVDGFGVVTVTTSTAHNLFAGSCCSISTANSHYNGAFQVINVVSSTSFKVRNLAAIGQGALSAGTVNTTTSPLQSTFQAQFNAWAANTSYPYGFIAVPTVPNGYYFKVIAPANGGLSSGTQPTWPTTIGATVQDGNITWQCAGLTASAAPPPPGAAHISVYAGALWVWDTYPSNTSNGLDGTCCLRMSDINNPNSWNPVNQAFIDKDDGTEGMGLATFTITAQGIPPQGSLVASKLYALYQIVGVFGSNNFLIQRIVTNMGNIAPRTLMFVPGYGIGRLTHLGVAIFDGVNDRLISSQISPYLFPNNDPELSDINTAAQFSLFLSYAVQTVIPAMYCVLIPTASMPQTYNEQLTEILCFDLVLKSWSVVNLPFPVSAAAQAGAQGSFAPLTQVTLLGSYNDGTLQRWQYGDVQWATAASGVNTPAPVAWSLRSTTVSSKDPDERLYCRRMILIGSMGNSPAPSSIVMKPRVRGTVLNTQTVPIPLTASGEFSIQCAVGVTDDRFDCIISGTGNVVIDNVGTHVEPKPIGILAQSFG